MELVGTESNNENKKLVRTNGNRHLDPSLLLLRPMGNTAVTAAISTFVATCNHFYQLALTFYRIRSGDSSGIEGGMPD